MSVLIMLENMLFYGEIYNAGKNFAQLALTNLTSLVSICFKFFHLSLIVYLIYFVYVSIFRLIFVHLFFHVKVFPCQQLTNLLTLLKLDVTL